MGYFTRFKNKHKAPKKFSEEQLEELKTQPRWVRGSIQFEGHDFYYHDAQCFYDSYQEIIDDEIYRFNTKQEQPVIIDCGANMGVSVLFFAKEYPTAKIIAFEPEEEIFDILQKNKESYQFSNVELNKKAVWDSETTLEFFTDHGMGGSVENTFKRQKPAIVQTVRLADFLQTPVAMLKLDIEGAEYTVLKDCEPYFKNVENIFVEYHSFEKKEQHLEELLSMFKKNGFRYHLRQSFSRKRPMVDKNNICENMDMAINVFAYREL